MTVLLKLIHALLFILLSNILVSVASFENCNAIYINGEEGESPGICTTFPECPTLFDILKSPYKTLKEVKLLQKLTCQPDNDNPTVCCALDDIKSEINNTYYAIGSSKQSAPTPNDVIVFGMDDSQQQRGKPATSSHNTPVNEVHPNFRLLPPLTKCSNAVFRDRIIGGEETSILDYPWLARIGYRSLEDNTIKYLCGATIINEKYFLTAAHCTQEVNRDEFEPVHVRVSETDVNCDEIYGCSTPRDFLIEKIIPHPNYNKRDKSNDLGLIRVTKEITFDIFSCPVCLPFIEEYGLSKEDLDPRLEKYLDTDKLVGYVAGYGKTRWTDVEGSPTLQHVTLPMLSHQQCKKSYQNHTRVSINTKQLCAGGQRGRDSCGGDSGGGLFIYEKVPIAAKVKQSKPFQIGIVSFGPTHCGVGNLPGVYSSVYDYKDWILDNLEP